MHSTALPPTLTWLSEADRQTLLNHAALLSLHQVFAAIPDPRSRHGRRYDLPFLLTCFVAALLCHCTYSEAVGQWCRAQHLLLRRLFGPRRFVCPTGALSRWRFPQLAVATLEALLARWVQATLVAAPDEPMAKGGKTVRGARTSTRPAPHLLSFCTHQRHEPVLQVAVDAKSNEIPVAQALLPTLPLRGRVCTADALHTQVAFMRLLHEQHADTVLTVKDHQPGLLADLVTSFADPAACSLQAETWDRHRGRTAVRRLKGSAEMTTSLAPTWPYVAEARRVDPPGDGKGPDPKSGWSI
jgi:predicted transposase YbfD/YdcC